MEQRTYEVESIHCEGCERAIRAALGRLDGVETVDADSRTNRVAVRFDPERVNESRVRDGLGAAGFALVGNPSGDWSAGGAQDGAGRFLLLVLAAAAVALAGYTGYVLYPRFDLPAVEGAAILGLAAAAGVAAFFSPCSFPLLLGILGRQASARVRDAEDAPRPVVFGGAMAFGAGAFLLLAGGLIAAGGGVLFEQVTFDSPAGIAIRAMVGVLLVVLGLVQVGVLPTPFHVVEGTARPIMRHQARLRRRAHPLAGYALFGFGYVLAGFG